MWVGFFHRTKSGWPEGSIIPQSCCGFPKLIGVWRFGCLNGNLRMYELIPVLSPTLRQCLSVLTPGRKTVAAATVADWRSGARVSVGRSGAP